MEIDYGGVNGLVRIKEFFDETTEKRMWWSDIFPDPVENKERHMFALRTDDFTDDIINIINKIKDLKDTKDKNEKQLFDICVKWTKKGDHPMDYASTINYNGGSGFAAHYDSRYRWGPIIVGINLGRSMELELSRGSAAKGNRQVVRMELPRRSIYLMTGEARTEWKHSIVAIPMKEFTKRTSDIPDWNINNMRRSIILRESLFGPKSDFPTEEELMKYRKQMYSNMD